MFPYKTNVFQIPYQPFIPTSSTFPYNKWVVRKDIE